MTDTTGPSTAAPVAHAMVRDASASADEAVTATAPELTRWRFGAGEVVLLVSADGPVRLVAVDTAPGGDHPVEPTHAVPLVELSLGPDGRIGSSPGAQHRRYSASSRLRPVGVERTADGGVDTLVVRQRDESTGLTVSTRLEHRSGAAAFRTDTTVVNGGPRPVTLHHLSTFALAGFTSVDGTAPTMADDPRRLLLTTARNAWFAEFRWRTTSLEEAGIVDIGPLDPSGNDSSLGVHAVRGTGSWSTGDFLPVGAVTDTATNRCWTWQVEHNGAWQWQAVDRRGRLCVLIGGPSDEDHQWRQVLAPGEGFTTVPAAVAVSDSGLDGALAQMTRHRRLTRRPNSDVVDLPVIFNDYMNCLMGDPTTQKLLPLVAAAQEAGAEYFVIDAGWYSDDAGWWDSVGEWTPSTTRFPNGLGEVTDAIRAAGMVPGLWLEPEVVGVRSPVVGRLPREALFCRDGVPLVENGRHQLDFRHPAVIRHLDETVERLISDFGVGYFKFDYNIDVGVGTDLDGMAPGAGLLGHNRAYSAWLDRLFARHPDLVVENCSSGGMRVDHAQLSRMNLQSTSDQTDPLLYVPISASAPASLTPEQSAVWAYPQPEWSRDVNDLTVVNALLGRVHLSGRLDILDEAGRARIADGIRVYKQIRHRIPGATGVWPLGLPGWYDPWCAVGLRDDDGVLLQVWRRGGTDTLVLPFPEFTGREVRVEVLYPPQPNGSATWSAADASLSVGLPDAPSARLYRLTVPRQH